MTPRAVITTATRIELLREQIRRDTPEVTRRLDILPRPPESRLCEKGIATWAHTRRPATDTPPRVHSNLPWQRALGDDILKEKTLYDASITRFTFSWMEM